MEKGGEGILGRERTEPRFGGQNATLCSDSLVELTPQQVKDDREWRVRRTQRIVSLGWEYRGISPGGAPKGMTVRGHYLGLLTVGSGIVSDIHTFSPIMAKSSGKLEQTNTEHFYFFNLAQP